ncbi:hypothetical protein CRG98_048818, partial [Punica granatum]
MHIRGARRTRRAAGVHGRRVGARAGARGSRAGARACVGGKRERGRLGVRVCAATGVLFTREH